MRIVIVEDEIKIRRGMANLITRHTEHTVVGEAKNGEEGLAMVRQYQPDLVITDIRMPVMDGLHMIQALCEEEIPVHCVILSGYSEFDYAKQAIRYGVDDYLIKPLAPEDLTGLLRSIQNKIARELRSLQGTPEKMIRDFLFGNLDDGENAAKLKQLCGFSRMEGYRLLCAYTQTAAQKDRKACLERFEKLGGKFPRQKFYRFFVDNTREFICLTEDENWEEIEQELKDKLLQGRLCGCGWVWTENRIGDLGELREAYQRVQEQYLYGMVLDCGTFLNAERIRNFSPEDGHYPKAEEHRLQTALYSGSKEQILSAGTEFVRSMEKAPIRPAQTKEFYMKMANFLMTCLQENNRRAYESLQNMDLIRSIGTAVTRQELQTAWQEGIRAVAPRLNQREDISNYTIRRAIDYIRNHYQESISLEEAAGRLSITPEYLSTLFSREMGETFSVFLKKFRMSHAKRLLKGTDKKIYEIAQEVGYSDPKYFNRVFKEEEGVSPGDYRTLH